MMQQKRPKLRPSLEDAISLAALAHKGQRDKGGEKYIFHPLRVMLSLSREDERMAAILHDVVEDTSVTLAKLSKLGYSKRVVDAVDYLSRRKGETYEDFIERVKGNSLAVKVKLADVADNLRRSLIGRPTPKDQIRIQRYVRAIKSLKQK